MVNNALRCYLFILFYFLKYEEMLSFSVSEYDITGEDFTCQFMKFGFHKYAEMPISDYFLGYFFHYSDAPWNGTNMLLLQKFLSKHKGRQITFGDVLWPNRRVPVELDFDNETADSIWELLNVINENTCVKILPKTKYDVDYIKLQLGKTMASYIGRVGGKQVATITTVISFEVYHVFMHILGFVHQHQAANRNDFVTIMYEAIHPNFVKDFKILKNLSQSFGIPYEYDSVTHYPQNYRTKSKFDYSTTMLAKDPNVQLRRAITLSQGDIWKIQAMYNCPGILDFNKTCT